MVYNAEQKFVGSGNYSAPVVKLAKKNQKIFILGHPTVHQSEVWLKQC